MTRRIPLIACVVATALYLPGCSKQAESEHLPPVVSTTQVESAGAGSQEASVYSAVVAPLVQVDLAFRSNGYVQSILKLPGVGGHKRIVQPGDIVHRGTILATVKQTEYAARVQEQEASGQESRAAVERAQAACSQAELSLQQAQLEYDRTSRLYADTSVTKPEFDGAQTKLDLSKSRLTEARAQLAAARATTARVGGAVTEARSALNDCFLKAPYDCVVVKRSIEEGSLVASGTPAVTICDPKAVKVSFGVPDVRVSQLHLGQQVACLSEAVPGVRFAGRITDIFPYADAKGRVFNIDVSLSNVGNKLRPGMIMFLSLDDVTAAKSQAQAVVIPLAAVVRSTKNPDGYAVYLAVKDGARVIAQERDVKLGDAFGQKVAVTDGLSNGDTVVTAGSARILPGQEVRVLN